MNDDDLSELTLRASAYLDGELTGEEMLRAEADPAVMNEVEQLRTLQVALRDVAPASDAAREAAISAALAAFDAIHATPATAPHPARVLPVTQRPSYARWLTAAAAVVMVGLLGVVIANGVGGGGDDEQGAAQGDTAAAFEADGTRLGEATAEAAVAEEADAALENAATAPAVTAAAELAIAEESATAADSADASTAAGGAPATTVPSSAARFDPERPIVDEFELGAAGAQLLATEIATGLTTPETSCDLDPYDELSFGRYQTPEGVREVLIAVDRTTLQTSAFDAATCALVATAPAP